MRGGGVGDVEAECGGEECPGHVGEGEEEEGAAPESVDRAHGGPGEGEVDEAETPGGEEGGSRRGVRFDVEGGGVEGHDVDYCSS